MIVLNITRKTTVTKDLKEVKTFLDKLLGLIRKSNPRSLLFRTRFGIHTFCLKELIDIVVLDRRYNVVKLGESIKPNSLFFWNPKYNIVLELPNGTIQKNHTKIGDKLSFNY